jgi:hypothetical protein
LAEGGEFVSVIEVRADLFPLVLTFIRGKVGDRDLDAFFLEFEGIYARRASFAVLSDLREVTAVPEAPVRRRIAEWSKAQEGRTLQYHLGTAMIVRSAVVRGALTAINWLTRPITPQPVYTDPREGAAWCLDALRRHELPIPSAAELYCRSVA